MVKQIIYFWTEGVLLKKWSESLSQAMEQTGSNYWISLGGE
jgi:hypothetical protein